MQGLYHAAQLAMTMSPNQGDARTFMFALLDQLEEVSVSTDFRIGKSCSLY